MKAKVEHKNIIGIYLIINLTNDKLYVGKSISIYKRIKSHINLLNKKSKNENLHLVKAWHKYGKSCFDYKVIEIIEEKNETFLKERELYWIQYYQTTNRNCGYNLRLDSSTKMICHLETRQKLSIISKTRQSDLLYRKARSNSAKIRILNMTKEEKLEHSKKTSIGLTKNRIAKCDKNSNEILEIFNNKLELHEKYPDYYLQAIMGCCQQNKKSYKGYKWCYIPINPK